MERHNSCSTPTYKTPSIPTPNFEDDFDSQFDPGLVNIETECGAPDTVALSSLSTNSSKQYVNGHAAHRAPPDESMNETACDVLGTELICPINAQDINNRWLNAYAPMPEQTIKRYPTNVASFIYTMLKSYAAAITHGRGGMSFIHASQMTLLAEYPQLSVCISLVRMCANPTPGANGALTVILEREMNNLHQQFGLYDGKTLRTAFQAYLIYAMVLYFCLHHASKSFLRQAMINLQDLACASSQHGVMCLAEQECVRPSWEAWIAAETQRRMLYLMCLFDNLLSTQDGLPTFLATELRGLPAPAGKSLWRASNRQDWERQYNIHLTEWTTGNLPIDDLWPTPDGMSMTDQARKRERIDRWLEDVDEFGTMLYAVTSCTHGT